MFDILVNEAELAEINLLVQGVRHDRIAKKGDWETMFFDRVITFRHLGVMQITVTAVPAPSSGTGWLYQVKFETMENGYWSECWSFVSDPYEMKLKELILENLQMFYDTTQGQKYRRGRKIVSMDELMDQEFVFLNAKLTHNGWFQSWQIRYALRMIQEGRLYLAILNDTGREDE